MWDADIENETCDAKEFSSYVKKIVLKIRRRFEKLNSSTTKTVASYQDRNISLPKLNIKNFTKKPAEWLTFIESFETAVDSNGALSNIQKVQYLKGYLSGQTERYIECFLLTNDNYTEAPKFINRTFQKYTTCF